MAEDQTGTGHTLLGTNALQGSVDKLDAAVDKLSSAADKMSASSLRISSGSGGSGSRSASGMWNDASNWMRGKANGGGATFNGQPASGSTNPASTGGAHRDDGPAQTPGWAMAGGNFAQAMANGNGGRGVGGAYSVGQQVAGTKGGLVAAGAVAAVSGLSTVANNGASQQDMYNANMLGGTATRMYNQGIGGVTGPRLSMNGVTGSQNAGDFYGGVYTLNSQSGYLQGSSGFNKMQSQAGAMGILDPTSNFATNASSMVGFSSNSTTNLMRAFGISSYGNDPTQIARQLLDRLGAPKGKIDAKTIQMLRSPQSGLNTTLNNMVAAGAIGPDQAKAIANAAYGILVAQNQGMSATTFDKLTQTASGDPKSQATQDAQSKLKSMGIGTSTAQTVMNKSANQTDDSVNELKSFAGALSQSTRVVNSFFNMINKWTGGALQRSSGASQGAGGGLMGKVFGGLSLGNSVGMGGGIIGSGVGVGMKALGSLTEGLGGPGTGAAGVGYSEAGSLGGGSTSGPGFVGAGTGAGVGFSSATSDTSGSSGYSSTPGTSSTPGGTGNGSPDYGTTQGIATGRVSPAQAIARIRAMAANRTPLRIGYCQHYVRAVYGIGAGAGSASAAWAGAHYKHTFKDSPPMGAFVFWGGGNGHVAIYVGGGKVWSPGGPGDLSHWTLCSISSITSGWGKPLLGWTEDDNGTRVVRPATTPHGGSSHQGVSLPGGNNRGGSSIPGVSGAPTPAGGGHQGSGSNMAIVQSVAKGYGWGGGSEWSALDSLVNSESGFNNTAQNPTSSAYGMFQFLDSTWGGYGAKKTSDPRAQAVAGLKYVKSRYGDPIKAWDFHKKHNWYDKGAWEIRNDEDARVHKGEMIIPKDPADQIRQVLLQNNTTGAGRRGGSGSGIVFGPGSVVITIQGGQVTAATGRALGKQFAQEFSQDSRIKALMAGTG